MIATKDAIFIDGLQLQLIKVRNVTRPGIDHRLRKSESRQARDFCCGNRSAVFRECRPICRPWHHDGPAVLAVERSPYGWMLLMSDLARSVGDAAAHIVQQTQQADSVSLPDFRGTLQGFDEVQG